MMATCSAVNACAMSRPTVGLRVRAPRGSAWREALSSMCRKSSSAGADRRRIGHQRLVAHLQVPLRAEGRTVREGGLGVACARPCSCAARRARPRTRPGPPAPPTTAPMVRTGSRPALGGPRAPSRPAARAPGCGWPPRRGRRGRCARTGHRGTSGRGTAAGTRWWASSRRSADRPRAGSAAARHRRFGRTASTRRSPQVPSNTLRPAALVATGSWW